MCIYIQIYMYTHIYTLLITIIMKSPKYGWPKNKVFQKGVKVNPMSDLIELLHQGQDYENKFGRDRGNGWLLRHPLKKLLLFQQFILNNPSFLASELKLKDYCF